MSLSSKMAGVAASIGLTLSAVAYSPDADATKFEAMCSKTPNTYQYNKEQGLKYIVPSPQQNMYQDPKKNFANIAPGMRDALAQKGWNGIFYVTSNDEEDPKSRELVEFSKCLFEERGYKINLIMQVPPQKDANGVAVKDPSTGESTEGSIHLFAYDLKNQQVIVNSYNPTDDGGREMIRRLDQLEYVAEIALPFSTQIELSAVASKTDGKTSAGSQSTQELEL